MQTPTLIPDHSCPQQLSQNSEVVERGLLHGLGTHRLPVGIVSTCGVTPSDPHDAVARERRLERDVKR